MHELRDYVPYTGQPLVGENYVLTWNRKDGYYFVQYGFLWPDAKIIAVRG